MQETHTIEMTFDAALVDTVASRGTEVESGARNVDNILTNTLLPDISRQLLGRMAANEPMQQIHVGIGADGAFDYR
jgi:type VI secretion system protein VasG